MRYIITELHGRAARIVDHYYREPGTAIINYHETFHSYSNYEIQIYHRRRAEMIRDTYQLMELLEGPLPRFREVPSEGFWHLVESAPRMTVFGMISEADDGYMRRTGWRPNITTPDYYSLYPIPILHRREYTDDFLSRERLRQMVAAGRGPSMGASSAETSHDQGRDEQQNPEPGQEQGSRSRTPLNERPFPLSRSKRPNRED